MPTAKQFATTCREVYERAARLKRASRGVRIYEGDKASDALWAEANLLLKEQVTLIEAAVLRLPFSWVPAHAYTPNEAHSYGGDDHITVLEDICYGAIKRRSGQTLGGPPSRKFWGLQAASSSEHRLPTCCACIGQAMAIVRV